MKINMNEEKLFKILKRQPIDTVPERVWYNIEQTLNNKQQPLAAWRIFPTAAFFGVALAALVLFSVSYYQKTLMQNYLANTISTEYIYQACRYSEEI